ncbi:BatD family protein [uncultured Maribacter sp.]|uniref:BatD family protein n=1 Tax=uncultured Maribacter sp. TaxID=431308 RepID=UPI002611F1E3|nr:BatD family protein [uncultured Maribacter sp.]
MKSITSYIKNNVSQCLRVPFLYLLLISSFFGFSQSEPSLKSEVDATTLKIGEQIHFKVTVNVDSTAQVIFPEGQTFSPLETVEAFKTDTTRKKDRITLQKTYALTQFDSGSYKLPQQRIEINGKGFFTDSLRIEVSNIKVDTVAQKMFDIKPLITVQKSNTNIWKIILAILFVTIIGGLVYWFLYRKKPLTEEEKVALLPPYDRALLELKKLENSKYLIQDEYKQYYSELTDIVRSYLHEDANVSALESTTDELIAKLELRKDAGELDLDKETISQFKKILQTADLVKFAKSKPPVSAAESDRKAVEQIVVKTHEAIPEPTEEELLEQAEYQEELARKQKRKKTLIAISAAVGAILLGMVGFTVYHGPTKVWDTLTAHPSKKMLDNKEWVSSSYGYPPISLETPEVLIRKKTKIPAEAQAKIKEVQTFVYQNKASLFTIATTSTTFNEQEEPDHKKSTEHLIENFEKKGTKNIITKNEEFTTIAGVKGLKTYGSGKFKIPNSKELIKGKYIILSFGGKGFQQQVLFTWLEDDSYAQQIIDRVVTSVEVKTES